MRISRIYTNLPLTCGLDILLTESTSHYISKVLRIRVGQDICLFNGVGGYYEAEILSIGKRTVEVKVKEYHDEEKESILEINLGQAISRSQHMDYTIQKAVELGVWKIVPLISEHSNVRLDEGRTDKRIKHWRGIIIDACEQCGRNRLPVLSDPISFQDWVDQDDSDLKVVFDPSAQAGLSSIGQPVKVISLLSGPEGGFSSAEIDYATTRGYKTLMLGPRVLRTETAAVAAISASQTLWGDMG